MTFNTVPSATDEAGLLAALLRDLGSNLRFLGLEDRCTHGGSIDWGATEIVNLRYHSLVHGFLEMTCSIYFSEISRGGCADTEIREEREARVKLRVDRKTGTAVAC